MERIYGTIKQFIEIKDKCIFCQRPLTSLLTNLLGHMGTNIPDISAPLHNKQFEFRLKYDGEREHFDVNATINIVDDKFLWYYNKLGYSIKEETVISVFQSMKPQIELLCENKDCGLQYCLQSDPIQIIYESHVRHIGVWLETFILDNWWICNQYSHLDKYTSIFSRQHPNAEPILCPRLDFESYSKGILINKIQTIVNFS